MLLSTVSVARGAEFDISARVRPTAGPATDGTSASGERPGTSAATADAEPGAGRPERAAVCLPAALSGTAAMPIASLPADRFTCLLSALESGIVPAADATAPPRCADAHATWLADASASSSVAARHSPCTGVSVTVTAITMFTTQAVPFSGAAAGCMLCLPSCFVSPAHAWHASCSSWFSTHHHMHLWAPCGRTFSFASASGISHNTV